MKHAQKTRRRHRFTPGFRLAIPAFLLSFIAFGSVLLLPLFLSSRQKPEPETVSGERNRERTVLLLIYDTPERLTGAVSLTGDTRTLTMQAVGYPPETEVVCRTRLMTLAECYAAQAETETLLEAITGEDYDAVLHLSVSAVAGFTAQMGGVPYVLAEPVGTLPQGAQTLSSLQVADVLRFREWTQDIIGPATAHAGITAAVVNRYLTEQRNPETAFRALSSLCDDRLTISQFEAVKEDLHALAKANNGTICRVVVPAGRIVGTGEGRRYVLTASARLSRQND